MNYLKVRENFSETKPEPDFIRKYWNYLGLLFILLLICACCLCVMLITKKCPKCVDCDAYCASE